MTTEEVNKYIYRKVVIEDSFFVEDLSDGSKKIVFQPIIYINSKYRKDLAVIELDKPFESITNNVSVTSVSNNNISNSLTSARQTSLDKAATIANGVPQIIKDLEQEHLIELTAGVSNHSEGLQTVNENQNVLEPYVKIAVSNFDDFKKPRTDSKQTKSYQNIDKMQKYCITCQTISTNLKHNKCRKCQSLMQFQCTKCFQLFVSHSAVKKHTLKCAIKTESILKGSKCSFSSKRQKFSDVCVPKNPTIRKLKQPYKCKVCATSYKYQRDFLKHFRTCIKKELQCPYCTYTYAYPAALSHHVIQKHQECLSDDYKCVDCGIKYRNVEGLDRHGKRCRKILKNTKLKHLYTCDHCNFQCYNKKSISKHVMQKNHTY